MTAPASKRLVTELALGEALSSIDGAGYEYVQASPAGTWTIPHSLERRPSVSVFLPNGEQIDTDVVADLSHVTITFAAPTAGSALLI